MKGEIKMSHGACVELRRYNGGKQLKEKTGLDRGMETEDVGKCINITVKRSVFACAATETATASALAAGRVTALSRCEARHSSTIRQ